jgi:hypothetical protein
MLKAKLAKSQTAFEAGQVVSLPQGGVAELLKQYRSGRLNVKR